MASTAWIASAASLPPLPPWLLPPGSPPLPRCLRCLHGFYRLDRLRCLAASTASIASIASAALIASAASMASTASMASMTSLSPLDGSVAAVVHCALLCLLLLAPRLQKPGSFGRHNGCLLPQLALGLHRAHGLSFLASLSPCYWPLSLLLASLPVGYGRLYGWLASLSTGYSCGSASTVPLVGVFLPAAYGRCLFITLPTILAVLCIALPTPPTTA
jgi:hypothetical protein